MKIIIKYKKASFCTQLGVFGVKIGKTPPENYLWMYER